MPLHPNNELVAVAWLKGIPYLGSRVATRLPTDNTTWSASGFVTAATIGGTPDSELPYRMPLISVDCWGSTPDGGQPPWNLASQLAEEVRVAVLTHGTTGRAVTLPAGYLGARVETVVLRTEPRRIVGDVSSYAHYTMDVEFWWKELTS